MIRRPPRSTLSSSSAASDVYKRQAPPPDEPEGCGPAPVGGHADSRRPEGRSHVGDLRGHRPPGRERARRPDPEDPANRNLSSPDYDARRRVREALAAFGARALGSTQRSAQAAMALSL